MALWCKKILLLFAGLLILAHNLTPHHHHDDDEHVASALHHDHGDESDGFMHFHNIDHAFVTQAHFHPDIVQPFIALLTPIFNIDLTHPALFNKDIAIPANESPPPLATIQRLSFRGPPTV